MNRRLQYEEQESVLLTVLGPSRSVDLALPSHVPVSELLPIILSACGSNAELAPVNPKPVWVVRLADDAPLGLKETLAEHHIADGTVLHLQDIAVQPRVVYVDPHPVALAPPPAPATSKWRTISRWYWMTGIAVACCTAAVGIALPLALSDRIIGPALFASTPQNGASVDASPPPLTSTASTPSAAPTSNQSAPAPQKAQSKPAVNKPTAVATDGAPLGNRLPTTHAASPAPPVKNADYWVRLGDAARAKHQYDASIANYKKAIAAGGNVLVAYYRIGDVYADNLKNPLWALAFYQSACSLSPKSGYPWMRAAQCQINLNQLNNARLTLNNALTSVPKQDASYAQLLKLKATLS